MDVANDSTVIKINEQVQKQINRDFQQIMALGTDLMSKLNVITSSNEYKSLVKTDGYVKKIKEYYSDLLKLCDEDENLDGMDLQIKILNYSGPNPISRNNTMSINNKKILSHLH